MPDLADVAKELVTLLRFYIDSALEAREPDDVGVNADSACTYYQGLAICELLLDAEVDEFSHYMIRSARARRWLLERHRAQPGNPVKLLKPSNTRGFFAAVLALDWPLADDIAELSAQQHDPDFEYEDDFWYAHLLHRVVVGDPHPALLAMLEEYRRSLAGEEPPRFLLCQALLLANEADALAAFQQLLEERRLELDEMRRTSPLATDDLFVPLSAIYVEGLAWLRLLERAGFTTAEDYIFCPSLARGESYAPFVDNGILGG